MPPPPVSVSEVKWTPWRMRCLLDFQIVFDDAVVDDGEFVVAADMRMGIAFGGHAMRGPARMPDAVHGDSVGIVGELFFQSRNLPSA